jgi:hypothetical protein
VSRELADRRSSRLRGRAASTNWLWRVCASRPTQSLCQDPSDQVGLVAMDERLGATLGQQGRGTVARVVLYS